MTDRTSGRRPSGGRPKRTASNTDRPTRPGSGGRAKGPSGPRDRDDRPADRDDRPRRESGPRSDRPDARPTGRPGAGGRTERPSGRDERNTSREERPRRKDAPRSASSGRTRPGQGGRPASRVAKPGARDERPRTDERSERPRSEGAGRGERPASKRAGKRPPKTVRDGSSTAWEGNRGPRPERPSTGRGASARPTSRPNDRRERDASSDERPTGPRPPVRGFRERDASTKRTVGRGPNRFSKRGKQAEEGANDGMIRLNRYLAHSGVASRREADELIQAGVVQVNGKIVTEMGTKVGPGDIVHYGGQKLTTEKKRYVLVNKPKDFITTTDDPQDRRTVMALIDDACNERLYPVGRLDRNTTGVLLMTNDGDLAKKLTHPSHGAEKIYYATLDKSVTKADLEKLVSGVHLDDGPANADEASYVVGGSKKEVGLKIHMGRNRIVRRMFEALGYEVVKLDRVVFAGLTKKDVPRGKWRHLTEKEVLFLSKRK